VLAAFARILLCRLVFEDGLLAAGAADEAAAPLLPLLLCQPDTFQVRRAPRPCPPFAARDSLLRGPETDAPSVTPALQPPARHLSQEVGLGLLARVRDPAHQGLLRGALEVGPAPRMERPGAESRARMEGGEGLTGRLTGGFARGGGAGRRGGPALQARLPPEPPRGPPAHPLRRPRALASWRGRD